MKGFTTRIRKKTRLTRPLIVANLAMTWDGKISTRNLSPADFSSKYDKHRLLEIRAGGDALMVGTNTIQRDNMSMGLPDESLRAQRVSRNQSPYPLRVILSNRGKIDVSWKIFSNRFSPIIIYSTSRMSARNRAALEGKATVHLGKGPDVDLKWVLDHLRNHYNVRKLVCEGGPSLVRHLLAGDFLDEIHITLCPRVFGSNKSLTLTGHPGSFLHPSVACNLAQMEIVGDECFLHYRLGDGTKSDEFPSRGTHCR